MKKLLAVISLILTVGCQYDPHAHLYTTAEPKAEDVVGIYELDEYHLSVEISGMPDSMVVELRSDGTFRAQNVPRWEIGQPDQSLPTTLLSGEGVWKKDTLGTLDPGNHRIWGVYLRSPDLKFSPAMFTGDFPPYGLIFGLGDPDSGYAILLRRQRPIQPPQPTTVSSADSRG